VDPIFFGVSCCLGDERPYLSNTTRPASSTPLTGTILDSKVVSGTECASWYGVTYEYRCEKNIHMKRTRHFIQIPRCIDDFGPEPHRPADLDPGQPIPLVMLNGMPSSALPRETLVEWIQNGDIDYDDVHLQSCSCHYDFFCRAWWAPYSLIAVGLELGLPLEVARQSLLPILLSLAVVWFLAGLPFTIQRGSHILAELLEGGEAINADNHEVVESPV